MTKVDITRIEVIIIRSNTNRSNITSFTRCLTFKGTWGCREKWRKFTTSLRWYSHERNSKLYCLF